MSLTYCQLPKALYLHIPFCFSSCPFCDFFKVVERRPEQHRLFVERLLAQLADLAAKLDLQEVETIFIGGGTPTALGAHLLEKLLLELRHYCAKAVEVTIETNPELLSPNSVKRLAAVGVTRISLGLQSMSDQVLAYLGRRNRAADNRRAAELLATHWLGSYSFDFIYGAEVQSVADISVDLDFIHKFRPPHVSWYQLTIEEGTPFAAYLRQGRIHLPTADTEQLLETTIATGLQAGGWQRYEISNYCLDNEECRHNCHYWQLNSYAGLGPGGVGTLADCRQPAASWRMQGTRSLDAYLHQPGFAVEWQWLKQSETAFEQLMMGLRLTRGLSLASFVGRFGQCPAELFPRAFQRSLAQGWITVEDGYFSATEAGRNFLNSLLADFWQEADR